MNTRPAWGLLLVGGILVLVLLLSPIWLKRYTGYIEEPIEVDPFPDAFYLLPNQAQDMYLAIYQTSQQMAQDLVAARLAEPVEVLEPNLPAIDLNPSAVQKLLTGDFVELDPLRSATGTASIYRLSDGRTIVQLLNLDALIGPDMHVLLTAYPRPTTQEALDQVPQYTIDLGELKGNQGNQNYIITDPAFNIENYAESSVVLYSARYELIFSYAALVLPETFSGS